MSAQTRVKPADRKAVHAQVDDWCSILEAFDVFYQRTRDSESLSDSERNHLIGRLQDIESALIDARPRFARGE